MIALPFRSRRWRTLAVAGFVALGAAAPGPGAPVPVLDHPVAKGQILAATDFVDGPPASEQNRGALRIRDAAGLEANRNLPAGSIVRSSDLIQPQIVRRGEAVTLTLRDNGLIIVTAGRALGSAAAGAPVRVVALATNRTLDGVVEGSGAVRIAAH